MNTSAQPAGPPDPEGDPGPPELLRGRLVYDSARTDHRIGTRSGISILRMLLFGAPGLSVDLAIHPGREQFQFAHGQVLRGIDERPVVGAQVDIANGDEPVTTDEYGEFAVAIAQPDAEHVLRIREGGTVAIFTIPAPCFADEEI